MYELKHAQGTFYFDDKGMFCAREQKVVDWNTAPDSVKQQSMQQLRSRVSLQKLREQGLIHVWELLQDAVNADVLIIQALRALREEELVKKSD